MKELRGKSGGTKGTITTKLPSLSTNYRSQKGAKTMPMGPEVRSVDEVLGMSSNAKPMQDWSCDDKQVTNERANPNRVEHD